MGKYYSEPKTRDEYLWQCRTWDEMDHRHLMYLHTVSRPCATRAVLLRIVLHNYIYHRWFRPYRSEIDHGRFICKFITPQHLPNDGSPPTPSTIETIISLNKAFCSGFEACRLAYDEGVAHETGCMMITKDKSLHILQPLFKALLIVISAQDYKLEDSKTVGGLPVLLVRTGIEVGLSEPITFEPIVDKMRIESYDGETIRTIRTTLEIAIDFVMELEAREVAAFGFRPSPITTWPSWKPPEDSEGIEADLPITGPSSQFVDTKKYKEWSGDGARYDSVIAPVYEEREFRHTAEWEKRVQPEREEANHGELKSVQQKSVNNAGQATGDVEG